MLNAPLIFANSGLFITLGVIAGIVLTLITAIVLLVLSIFAEN